jgi:hypothetical protein
MYTQRITRKDPGCVVLLLDRSDSMKVPWGKDGRMSLAQGATLAINNLLFDLCVKATAEAGGSVKHHFDIGIFGYGACPVAQTEGVESAFGGALAGQAIVGLPHVAANNIGLRETPSVDQMSVASKMPVWIEPVHGYRTPMCEAIAVAGAHVHDWTTAHPNSFPPIVINITDGMVTDSPYEGADLQGWAQRLSTIATSDGPALLFNIFLSPSSAQPLLLPPTANGLPDPGPDLFEISSPLPPKMVATAQAYGAPVQPGARGFAFNADFATLVKFLDIGTQVG